MVREEERAAPADALAEAKAYLRVDGTADDASIAGLLGAAIATCEAFGGVTLIARDHEEELEVGAGWIRLSRTPVREIAGVDDAGGAALPVDAYAADVDADGDGWVRVTADPASARITVRYRAGLAESWSGVPAPLRQGVVRLAAHFHAQRGDGDPGPPPAAVTALWRPYRRLAFGAPKFRGAR